jgi:hypothetical protein
MKVSDLTPVIRKLLAAFPHANASAETVGVYVQYLADIPLDHLKVVIDQVIMESEFLPTVAKIRERYIAMITPERPSAADAWGLVLKQIMRVGHVGTPTFDDPVIERVVKGMGWRDLCLSENQMADRAHFIKLYAELVERDAQDNRQSNATRQLTASHRELRAPGLKSIGAIIDSAMGSDN